MTTSSIIQQTNSRNKSISKTLAILSTFTEETPMQRTSDIAVKLGLNISTVSRHLNTLLDSGYLKRDDQTGYYYPGLQIITLAGITLQSNDVYRHALPELQQLSHKYGVYAHLGVPKNEDIIHLICCCCKSTNELLIPMGHHHPMYCSAMGRAILAYMPSGNVQLILKNSALAKHTSETKIDIEEIQNELLKTKKQGYCVVLNELSEGVASIAAPIFDRSRNPIAAISISSSLWRLKQPQSEQELSKAILSVAKKISGKLGYYPR
jgi:DNA-binding IclR family transcriptional regulator